MKPSSSGPLVPDVEWGVHRKSSGDAVGPSKLDQQLLMHFATIERIYGSLSRHLRIRVEKWVEKLSCPTNNHAWKKNANNYCILLIDMIKKKSFTEPFHTLPGDGPLPTLPTYLTIQIENNRRQSSRPVSPRRRFWPTIYSRIASEHGPGNSHSFNNNNNNNNHSNSYGAHGGPLPSTKSFPHDGTLGEHSANNGRASAAVYNDAHIYHKNAFSDYGNDGQVGGQFENVDGGEQTYAEEYGQSFSLQQSSRRPPSPVRGRQAPGYYNDEQLNKGFEHYEDGYLPFQSRRDAYDRNQPACSSYDESQGSRNGTTSMPSPQRSRPPKGSKGGESTSCASEMPQRSGGEGEGSFNAMLEEMAANYGKEKGIRVQLQSQLQETQALAESRGECIEKLEYELAMSKIQHRREMNKLRMEKDKEIDKLRNALQNLQKGQSHNTQAPRHSGQPVVARRSNSFNSVPDPRASPSSFTPSSEDGTRPAINGRLGAGDSPAAAGASGVATGGGAGGASAVPGTVEGAGALPLRGHRRSADGHEASLADASEIEELLARLNSFHQDTETILKSISPPLSPAMSMSPSPLLDEEY